MHDGLRETSVARREPFSHPQSALQHCNRSMARKILKIVVDARTSATPAFQHAPAAF
jgi:hypothetical protein